MDYFRLSAVEMLSDVWFESNGVPLRTNLPIGVLYDMMNGKVSSESHALPISPWGIVIHFTGFPTEKVMKCPNEPSSARLFAHSLKQALFLLYGSTRAYNTLPIDSQESLWLAAKLGQLSGFDPLVEILMPNIESIRVIPVRILFASLPTTLQRPFNSTLPDGNVTTFLAVHTTIEDYLKSIAASTPSISSTQGASGSISAAPSAHISNGSSANASLVSTATTTDDINYAQSGGGSGGNYGSRGDIVSTNSVSLSESSTCRFTVCVQGISVPINAKLFDVWSVFCHADLFLYVVVNFIE